MFVQEGLSGGSAVSNDKEMELEQNRYSYIKKIGRMTYSVVIRQSDDATERVESKVKRLLLNDLANGA